MHEDLSLDNELTKQYWTEHRITLIAFEMQYVYHKHLAHNHQPQNKQGIQKPHPKRKNIEYEGGFLFPGRKTNKQNIDIQNLIFDSSCSNLKELFFAENLDEDWLALQQLVRIMLSLKHSLIIHQFMELYELVLSQTKDIRFEQIAAQEERRAQIEGIASRVVLLVQEKGECRFLRECLQQNRLETTKLIKVTIYCFLAERYNFNINEYYAQAFEATQPEIKPFKRLKLS